MNIAWCRQWQHLDSCHASGPSHCIAMIDELFAPSCLQGRQWETASLFISSLDVIKAIWTHLMVQKSSSSSSLSATYLVLWFTDLPNNFSRFVVSDAKLIAAKCYGNILFLSSENWRWQNSSWRKHRNTLRQKLTSQ